MGQWVKLIVMSKSRSYDCVQKIMSACPRNKSLQAGLYTFFFNTAVTEWLKEQSPLSEDELQKLCISMDDFKVLNNLL